ncbi:hypothetical protein Bhyg_12084, partial [Pseudolycoriella hygida]
MELPNDFNLNEIISNNNYCDNWHDDDDGMVTKDDDSLFDYMSFDFNIDQNVDDQFDDNLGINFEAVRHHYSAADTEKMQNRQLLYQNLWSALALLLGREFSCQAGLVGA